MNKLLLIMGDLATGKSTFANILSERYHVNLFFKDSIKEVLGDTIGFSNREENKKLSNAAMELMYFIFAEFGKLGKDLILESNFHTAELEKLHKMASENHYEVLTLVLRGDVEILHKRYLNRFEDFKECTEYLRSEKIPGTIININADDFAYQTDNEVLSQIDDFMRDCES